MLRAALIAAVLTLAASAAYAWTHGRAVMSVIYVDPQGNAYVDPQGNVVQTR